MTSRERTAHEPVVLLHGAISDDRVWKPYFKLLAANDCEPILPALKGFFPRIVAPHEFSSAQNLDATSFILEGIGRPVHLIGHSRGGRLALALAARHPAKVRSLVLIEPGGAREESFFGHGIQGDTGPDLAIVRDALARGAFAEAVEAYIDAGHGKGTWRRLPAIYQSFAVENAASLLGTLDDRTVPLTRAEAAKVHCPTLLLTGTQSPSQFSQINAVLAAHIPLSESQELKGGDHFEIVRNPERVGREIVQFIVSRSGSC